MTAPRAASEAVNRAAGSLPAPGADASWMRDPAAGLGRLGACAAAILARALGACLAGGPYVESLSSAASALGVRRATACDARRRLVESGLLEPCGLEAPDGSPARSADPRARVNNQLAYEVDVARLMAAWNAARGGADRTAPELGPRKTGRRRDRSHDAPDQGELKTPGDGQGARPAKGHRRTASELGFRALEGGTVKIGSKEKKKEKKGGAGMNEHMAAFRALSASWPGTSRMDMREAAAYMALIARGFQESDIQRAADEFARWVAGTEEGTTRMGLGRFLADSGAKFLASARRARERAGRSAAPRAEGPAAQAPAPAAAGQAWTDGQAAPAARAAAAKPAAPADRRAAAAQGAAQEAPLAPSDLAFEWAGDGTWEVTTPRGFRAAFYPSWPLCLPSAGAEDLRAAWVRAYGERGAWSTFRAIGASELEVSWVEEAAGQGHWAAAMPGAEPVSLRGLWHGRRADATPAQLLAEVNADGRTVRALRAAGRRAA